MKRHPFLRMAVEGFATGAAGAAVANGAWLFTTGHSASLFTMLLLSEAVTTAWGIGQAVRFRRKWLAVLASYNAPALGEGIDIPHRPPTPFGEDGEAA